MFRTNSFMTPSYGPSRYAGDDVIYVLEDAQPPITGYTRPQPRSRAYSFDTQARSLRTLFSGPSRSSGSLRSSGRRDTRSSSRSSFTDRFSRSRSRSNASHDRNFIDPPRRNTSIDHAPRGRELQRSLHRTPGVSDMRSAPTYNRRQGQSSRSGVPGYELVKALKTGGMSEEVNLVRSKQLGKLFIEKRVRAGGPRAARTTAELNALNRIQRGQNLNYMVAHLWDPRRTHCTFILEYCDAGSLADKIESYTKSGRKAPEDFAWHVLVGVANGLAFLHHGIKDAARNPKPIADWNTTCHLDLKPCNIFLSTTGQSGKYPRVVLGDFGCAVTQSDIDFGMEHPRRQGCGTPSWYPPEGLENVVGRGRTRYGTETDCWQLGATIHSICKLLPDRPDKKKLDSGSPCGSKYSKALNKTASAAANSNWKKRPSAAQLVKDVVKRETKTGFLF